MEKLENLRISKIKRVRLYTVMQTHAESTELKNETQLFANFDNEKKKKMRSTTLFASAYWRKLVFYILCVFARELFELMAVIWWEGGRGVYRR